MSRFYSIEDKCTDTYVQLEVAWCISRFFFFNPTDSGDKAVYPLPPLPVDCASIFTVFVTLTDFNTVCDGVGCLPTLDIFADAVKHVQEELRQKKGVQVQDGDVIVTSDETRNEWWDQVRTMGWKRIESGLGPEPHGKDLWSVPWNDVNFIR